MLDEIKAELDRLKEERRKLMNQHFELGLQRALLTMRFNALMHGKEPPDCSRWWERWKQSRSHQTTKG